MTATDATLDGLLRAVLERPDDDLPRLVLADWWDEHGQPERAEFCRVQCELALFERWCNDPDCGIQVPRGTNIDVLRQREGELLTSKNALAWGPSKALWDAGLKLPTCMLHDGPGPLPGYVVLRFRRGFVEEVRLPLEVFAGGPCGRCNGIVRPGGCDLCGNAGPSYRTPGVAPALFGSQPIWGKRAVTLTDREPWNCGGGWAWWRENVQAYNRASLPGELCDKLPESRDGFGGYTYDTRDAALAALSAACVAHGRSVAAGRWWGVCERCEGEKRVWPEHPNSASEECDDCDGTGKRRGLPPLAGLTGGTP